MIRRATIADFPQWQELGARLLARTPYASIPIDQRAVAAIYGQCVNSKLACCFVAEHDGKITGTIAGVVQELWFARRRYASDLLFVAETPGDGPKLLRAFVDWAWSVPNVAEVTCGQSSGIDIQAMDGLYRWAGMRKVGAIYTIVRQAGASACLTKSA